MKIVINSCFGGFGLSEFAVKALGLEDKYSSIDRTDPALIYIIEKFGSKACSGYCAKLEVAEIPDNATDWELDEYDGSESITYVVDGKIHHIH